MISLSSFQIFNNHISNLKQTSIDDSDNSRSPQFMTDSLVTAINYDAVKDEYVRTLQLSEIPKSNDALFDDGRGHLVFVEFKNGKIGRRKQFEIRKKIYDSVFKNYCFNSVHTYTESEFKHYLGTLFPSSHP